MRITRLAAALAVGVLLSAGLAAPANAAVTRTVTAVGNYTAANDSTSASTDAPRGQVTFTRVNGGTITYVLSVTGLGANTQYFPVPYKDPYCAPLPGVSAFPASPFKTDANGTATNVTGTVNPKALNPLGRFRLRETKSISLRRVLGTVNLPTGTPPYPLNLVLNPAYNAPTPVTESCDRNPSVTRSVSWSR